ncbi:hypothetical protein TrRE_jg620, partial [Triparma retinervis]
LAAPKTALEEAKEAAAIAKKAAAEKALGISRAASAAAENALDALHRKMTSKEKKSLRLKRASLGRPAEKLNTPKFARRAGYVRCNCVRGVPNDEPAEWVAVQETRYVGEIEVRAEFRRETFYKEAMEPTEKVLALVNRFLDARSLGKACMVNTKWRKMCEDQTGMETYNLLHTPIRDTALIPMICKANQSLYSAASNGAVREWVLAHNIKNIKFSGAMWEHSGWINDICCSAPTPGTCSMHGVVNHVCLLYTASDDRCVYVWDSVSRKRLGKIQPPNKTCGTMRKMALSDRHLFVGSSNGIIYVYPFEKTCERPDRHECSLAAGPKRFCLQTQLR